MRLGFLSLLAELQLLKRPQAAVHEVLQLRLQPNVNGWKLDMELVLCEFGRSSYDIVGFIAITMSLVWFFVCHGFAETFSHLWSW